MKNSISSRQAAIIACIMIFANKVLTLPSLLYEKSKADSIFILFLMFLIDLFVLFIFFRLKGKYQDKSFFEILSQKLSKPVAIAIYALFFAYYLIILLINFNFTHVYFRVQVYHDDQESVFLFVAAIIMICAVTRGLRPFSRTLEFFYFFIVFGFFACIFIAISNFKEFPILFDSNFKDIFLSSYHYAFAFGDMLYLFLIMDRVELTKKGQKQIIKYILLAMSIVIGGYFMFFSIYQNTVFMHPNAVSDILVLSYQTLSIGRLEILAVVIIMLLTLGQLGLYSYILTKILMQIFPKMTKVLSIIIVITLFYGLYILFFNNLDMVKYAFTGNVPILAIILQYFLPIVLLIIALNSSKKEEKG